MNAMESRELCCGYGARRVLESVSLAVRAGEVLILLGPNGAGKTTLLRALARLLRPTRGTVLLHDQEIWSQPVGDVSRRLALMPQSERRDWPLTVEESVYMGRAPHRGWVLPFRRADGIIVEQALRHTGLWDLRDRPITELSGGEWRRVILARALAQQADALLLDEPTAGLDLKYQVEVLRLIRGLAARERLAVVLTLHDLNLAAIYGDRIALLSERSLAACGAPKDVLTEELIGPAFGVPVTVTRHPVYNTPLVVPLPDLSSINGDS
ncbi:MAG: ABC transporter ATP-binding protein [Acidobacteria bacterium]|nr:ABC transporter ATP-binding protein [Acidobacteriota bacterium]